MLNIIASSCKTVVGRIGFKPGRASPILQSTWIGHRFYRSNLVAPKISVRYISSSIRSQARQLFRQKPPAQWTPRDVQEFISSLTGVPEENNEVLTVVTEKKINGAMLLNSNMDWQAIGLEAQADAIKEQLRKWRVVAQPNSAEKLEELKSLCPPPSPKRLLMPEEDILELWKDKPVSKYWDITQIPFNPANGKVDFHFLKEPFFPDDPVIEALHENVKSSQSKLVTMLGVSGVGKTGSIFAYAQKQYVLYLEVNHTSKGGDRKDILDNAFPAFYNLGSRVTAIIAENNCSPSLGTDIMTCLTQLLWLSQAIVLNKFRTSNSKITPRGWIAVLSDSHPDIATTMQALGDNFINELIQVKCNREWVETKLIEHNACLEGLTQDVVFAVDEAQAAQGMFEQAGKASPIKFVNALNEKRTFLSVLVHYSLPPERTVIVTGTRMTNFDDLKKSGESKPSNDLHLNAKDLQFPLITSERAIAIAMKFFPSLKKYPSYQQLIGNVTEGRLRRITTLVWLMTQSNSRPTKFADLVDVGVTELKDTIRRYVHGRLNDLNRRFATDEDKDKWFHLLKQLYVNTTISSNRRISDQVCKELGVNLEDLGFALVTKQVKKMAIDPDGTTFTRHFSICEPLSFEIFRDWMISTNAGFNPYVTKFENDLADAVDASYSPAVNAKGGAFESLLGALLLNMSKMKEPLPIKKLPVIASLPNLPEWTEAIAFPEPWTFYGDAEECADLVDATKILMKTNFRSHRATLIQQFKGSPILSKLFQNEGTFKAEKEVLQAIKAAGKIYVPELLLLLTKYDKALVKPTKYFGPDLIGFKGDVLYSTAAYCYSSPTVREDFKSCREKQQKQVTKFTSNYQNKEAKPFPRKAFNAWEAIKSISKWKEIRLDVRMPQTTKDNSYVSEDGEVLHVIISQENFAEITVDKQKWYEIANNLEYKKITDYTTDMNNK